MAPPPITATRSDGCTYTCMLVDADFLEAVFVTVAVSVYMMDVVNENGGSRNFDGSREDDITDALDCWDPLEEGAVMLQEYCKYWVEVEPSQLAVKAFVATDRADDLDCVSTWGPTMVMVGTIRFRTTIEAIFVPQCCKKLHIRTENV